MSHNHASLTETDYNNGMRDDPSVCHRSVVFILLGLVFLFSACTAKPEGLLPTLPSTATPAVPTATMVLPSATSTPTTMPSVTPMPSPTGMPLALPLSEETAYLLPPTIRYLTGESASLFFELDQPVSGQVYFQPESGETIFTVPFIPGETRQNLLVSGLSADTAYHVLVAIEENNGNYQPGYQGRAWGPLTFTTPVDAGQLRVGFISDASFGDETTMTMIQAMAAANLDFVIHGGDVADALEYDLDPSAFYADAFYIPFEPLLRQMPVYTVPGNHDYDWDIRYQDQPFYFHAIPLAGNALSGSPNMQYYAVVQDGIQFLFLDSQVLFGAPGLNEEEAWLKERLADEDVRFTIPVVHVAPFSSSAVHPEDSLPVQRRWVPEFEKASVPLVLSGHFHHYERLLENGTTYLVAGGGSEVLYALGTYLPQSEVVLRQSHWVLLEFNENSIHIVAYGKDGNVLDETYLFPDAEE